MKTLDTRQKIRPAAAIANLSQEFSGQDTVFVRAAMDPLTLAHARRLAALAAPGRSIVLLLADPPEPLLPQPARAELAAALESVSVVVTGLDPSRLAELPASSPLIDELGPDLDRRQRLMESVHARHSATS